MRRLHGGGVLRDICSIAERMIFRPKDTEENMAWGQLRGSAWETSGASELDHAFQRLDTQLGTEAQEG